MYKVGLITMHNVCNMGAVLQAYAIQHLIENKGVSCEIMNYVPNLRKGFHVYFPKEQGVSKTRRILSNMKWLPNRILWQKPYKEFVSKHLNVSSHKFYSNRISYEYEYSYDCMVTGSDQVWNPSSTDGFDPFYFLDFYKGKKVSYAASISTEKVTEQEKKWLKEKLEKFTAISVREKTGVDLLINIISTPIEQTLDPTMLLERNEWRNLSKESTIKIKEKYLLIYILGSVPILEKKAVEIAKQLNLKTVKFGWDLINNKEIDYSYNFKTPQDFIKLFEHASYVVTNSFHGLAYSINFNIDFTVLPSSPGNPRYISILNMFKLTNRLYDEKKGLVDYSKIDYEFVNNILENERKKSLDFIEKNIIGSV